MQHFSVAQSIKQLKEITDLKMACKDGHVSKQVRQKLQLGSMGPL